MELRHIYQKQDKQRSVKLWYVGLTKICQIRSGRVMAHPWKTGQAEKCKAMVHWCHKNMSDTLGRSCGTLNLPKAEEIQKRRFVAH